MSFPSVGNSANLRASVRPPGAYIYFLFGAFGSIPISLQIIPSITSSAPPPIETSLMSRNILENENEGKCVKYIKFQAALISMERS